MEEIVACLNTLSKEISGVTDRKYVILQDIAKQEHPNTK